MLRLTSGRAALVLMIALVAVLFATPSYAQTGMVKGKVLDGASKPLDKATNTYGTVVPGTIEEQTALTLRHIEKILNAGGGTFDDVVKSTVHLADINEFARYNAEYAKFFTGVRPARTTVQSGLWGGMKIEIDVVARLPK